MLNFHVTRSRPQEAVEAPPFHEWVFPDGVRWTAFYRAAEGFLLRFPDLCDYRLSADCLRVTCHPVPGVPDATIRDLYLNQVLPLALSQRGKLVLHASAVEVDGRAAVFLGESGRGKSTLAASFASAGHRFLADDGLVLEREGQTYVAQPSHPSIRLWQDSETALLRPPGMGSAQSPLPAKARHLPGSRLAFCGEPRVLGHIYALGRGTSREVAIEKLSPREAVVGLLSNSFLLDIKDQALLSRHFDRIADLAQLPICYRLDYPRMFEVLPEIRQAILKHCGR